MDIEVGEFVFVPWKNRLGYDCSAKVERIVGDIVTCLVYNANGPGANVQADFPIEEVERACYTPEE